jgi:hypothetical protein
VAAQLLSVVYMERETIHSDFRYYMHDGTAAFSFELSGRLSDDAARQLEQAWRTASSVVGKRSLIVDLSYVSAIDPVGQDLLRDWHNQGAQFVANSQVAIALLHSITGLCIPRPAMPVRHSTWLPFRIAAYAAITLVVVFFPGTIYAANLMPETLNAWDDYIEAATARMQKRVTSGRPFLSTDEAPGGCARLRTGEILVSPADSNIPRKVPSGLIHHWIGAAFIPNAKLTDVLTVVRDYEQYRQIYHPAVIDSRAVSTSDVEDRFSLLLMNKSVISKTALDSDYRVSYFRVNDARLYSVSESMRVQEIAGFGTASQHTVPKDEGTGIIWRAYSITRFEERDGGVYIEIEALVLSRNIPVTLRWLVDPIVRRVSRETLHTSLLQTREAVEPSLKPPDYSSTGITFSLH